MKSYTKSDVEKHLCEMKTCTTCPAMIGPVIGPAPILTKVYLAGQAPGPREGQFGRPFAWTAGKRMFGWFEAALGINEEQFRSKIYIGAVCRCFPGKTKQGGDRVPSPEEIKACSRWMQNEFEMLQPQLVLAVGRLAIEQFLPFKKPLSEIIGQQFKITKFGQTFDVIPIPHPSGASTWFHREPGKTLLADAMQLIAKHPAVVATLKEPAKQK